MWFRAKNSVSHDLNTLLRAKQNAGITSDFKMDIKILVIRETHKGLKRVTGVQCSWKFTFIIFGNLSEGYPFSTKWLQHHEVVLTPKFCISRLKIHHQMERESSKECSVFFLWRKGSFSSRNRPLRNSTLFSSRWNARSVLKCNQGSKVFGWSTVCANCKQKVS